MTLKNLLGISLDVAQADKVVVARLLAAAERNIADAQLPGLSTSNRFDASYKAIMQLAMLALNANGYRTLTSKPGHHQTAIQSLVLSVEVPRETVIILDALRKQRNQSDYSGELITDAAAAECLSKARKLLAHVEAWLDRERPDLRSR
ncbi:MAG: DNA-binding protein [Burkholderiales bacterium]|jgi:HEPN domain-containing protein|nr:DNA-binding protein [Burkholderiales bacterium]